MKIRHKLVILLAVLLITLNGVIAFFIYQRTRHEFTKEVREEAKLIAMELEITRNYLASALKASKLGITDQTKHFIPAVSGSVIGLKFAEKTGYVIKQTSIKYRNLFNKPDAFEEKVLREMEADPNLVEYWDSDVVDGKRVERYLYALHVKEDCLLCHGKKELARNLSKIIMLPATIIKPASCEGPSALSSQKKSLNNVLRRTSTFLLSWEPSASFW